jgi:poly-gamma-glutamate synthesis protein (capsule biosynthesis protein)
VSEPVCFESVVVNLEYDDKKLKSISLVPIEMNYIGKGVAHFHSRRLSDEFVRTRGLPKQAKGDKARYILERVVKLSKPFGTKVEIEGDTARIALK